MCGAYIGDQNKEIICPDCLRILPRTEQDTLRQNSTEMALTGADTPSIRERGQYMVRMKKVMHLNRAGAFLFYEKGSPVQHLIHKMKYADQPEIAYQLGRQAAMEFQYADFFDEIDVIVPMPIHPKRFRERGYNQSEYIAKGISDITGIPIDTTHVVRSRNTPKQALQKGDERKQNVAEAFRVNHPEQMYHKHILLVDDLITTGETVKACLRAMKKFRGASFSVFALCKAQ